jgi:hypothetical protein
VPRWSIRTPVARRAASRTPAAVIPGMRRDMVTSDVELGGIQVTGGDVSEVRRGLRTIWERGRVGFRVRVIDAMRGTGLPESMLTLDGSDSSTTGADGVALFSRVVPGTHRLAVRTATMAALDVSAVSVGVSVPDEQQAPLRVEAPPERASLVRACGERVAARHESLLRGSLRTSALPVPATRVEATWQAGYTLLGSGQPLYVPRRASATTDAHGEFVICGLPRGLAVSLRPLRGRANDAATTVMIPSLAVAAEQRLVVEP